jgi:hypothetical protein
MPLLTLDEQFVRELHEILAIERLLIGKIPLIRESVSGLSIEFLRCYLGRKYDQAEGIEEILRLLNSDIAGAPSHESSLAADIKSLIRDCEANHSAAISALEDIAELLRAQYKKVGDHARILGMAVAEELLDQAHLAEANTCIALTHYEFHHAAPECERFSSADP